MNKEEALAKYRHESLPVTLRRTQRSLDEDLFNAEYDTGIFLAVAASPYDDVTALVHEWEAGREVHVNNRADICELCRASMDLDEMQLLRMLVSEGVSPQDLVRLRALPKPVRTYGVKLLVHEADADCACLVWDLTNGVRDYGRIRTCVRCLGSVSEFLVHKDPRPRALHTVTFDSLQNVMWPLRQEWLGEPSTSAEEGT